jgi:hypothetical protein
MALDNNTALTFVENDSASSSPTSPPVVTIISVDHYKISKQSGIDHSDLVFSFDTDVTSWSVNVMGVDPTSGTIVASGGAISSGNNISISIPWNDMYQEGANRINLYGQNSVGWTPYDNSSGGTKTPVFLSPTQIILI